MPSESPFSRRLALRRGAALLGLAALEGLRASPVRASGLRVGQEAPPATLVTLDGRRISTPELRGKVVILTFWATWCGPCRQELPLLSAFAEQHADDGLVVLGFSIDAAEDLAKVRLQAEGLSFPVGLLSEARLPGYGRIWRIPANFTIDRAGLLRDNGWDDREAIFTAARLQEIVVPLLRAP